MRFFGALAGHPEGQLDVCARADIARFRMCRIQRAAFINDAV